MDCDGSVSSMGSTRSLKSKSRLSGKLKEIKEFKKKLSLRRSKSDYYRGARDVGVEGVSHLVRGHSTGNDGDSSTHQEELKVPPQDIPSMEKDVMDICPADFIQCPESLLPSLPTEQDVEDSEDEAEATLERQSSWGPDAPSPAENSERKPENNNVVSMPYPSESPKSETSPAGCEAQQQFDYNLPLDASNDDDGIYEEDDGELDGADIDTGENKVCKYEDVDTHDDQKEVKTENNPLIKMNQNNSDKDFACQHEGGQEEIVVNTAQEVAGLSKKSSDKDLLAGWKNVGRKHSTETNPSGSEEVDRKISIDSTYSEHGDRKNSIDTNCVSESIDRRNSIDTNTSEEDTIHGWQNVGADASHSNNGDGTSMRSSSNDLGGKKHPSDGFLDEYPEILDEGKENGVPKVEMNSDSTPANTGVVESSDKRLSSKLTPSGVTSLHTYELSTEPPEKQSPTEKTVSPAASESAQEFMAHFSSHHGPSPVKMENPDHFHFDVSMETSLELSTGGDDMRSEMQLKSDELMAEPPEKQSTTEKVVSTAASESAQEWMSRFSTFRGPSPMKMKTPDHFHLDVTTETSMELSKGDDMNNCSRAQTEDSDGNINIWNGNGMDIEVDEATTTTDNDREDSTYNESRTDADAAAESISLNEGSSVSRSQLVSPLTVAEEPIQQPQQIPNRVSKRSLQMSTTQHSNIPTTTSMLHLEYNVDHSCSTPLERLARDIGNAFRHWHVHKGCDRHAPLHWTNGINGLEESSEQEQQFNESNDSNMSKNESVADVQVEETIEKAIDDSAPESNQIMSMDLCMSRFANRSRKLNEWMGEDTTKTLEEHIKIPSGISVQSKNDASLNTIPQPGATSKEKLQQNAQASLKTSSSNSDHCGARCIRSKKILFETIGLTPSESDASSDGSLSSMVWTRRRYSIPLLLSLWDAPLIPGCNQSHMEDDKLSQIPLSLRPDLSYSSHALLGQLGLLSSCGTNRVFYDHQIQSNEKLSQGVAFSASTPPLDTGLARDISSLFNIGQHITLSLDLESAQISAKYQNENKQLQDIQSLYNDIHAYLTDTIQQALEQKALAAQRRRRRLKKLQKRALKRRQIGEGGGPNYHHSNQCRNSSPPGNVRVGSLSMSQDTGSEDGDEQVLFNDTDENLDDEHSTSDDDETLMMSLNEDLHLDEREIDSEVISSLSSVLQSALNLAASENDCSIPVFGLWGRYRGACTEKDKAGTTQFGGSEFALPSWIQSYCKHEFKNSPTGQFAKHLGWQDAIDQVKNLLLSSPTISGCSQQGSFRSTHRLYSIPRQTLPMHLSTLQGLSCVLLSQCPSHTNKVMVTSARHCYHMDLVKGNSTDQEWRLVSFIPSGERISAVEVYRETCRRQASFLLERASSPWMYKSVPIWGPSEGNPLMSLSASVSWGAIPSQNTSPETCDILSPSMTKQHGLLQLPLKIRSSNFVPNSNELLDIEYSLQSAAFDPLGMGVKSKDGNTDFGPREPIFFASVRFEKDLPCATLSANIRCVLAALLRCGSLGLDALPGHLTRRKVLSTLGTSSKETLDEEMMAESETMLKSALKHVGPVTTRLVDAMDWADVGTITSNADVDRAIADALQRIGAGGLYPDPPVEVFAMDDVQRHRYHSMYNSNVHQAKGSPPGRLLSILFAHMARLRTPPSMMSLWLSFVETLRSRWDENESLPNLGHVPGLDDDAEYKHICGMRKTDHRVLGHRAHLAAFLNSSEPDPDRNQCIINQKLQVFNICIESKMSLEAQNDTMEVDESYSNSDDDEFFDPEEEVSFQLGSREIDSNEIEAMLKQATAASAHPSHNRIGARCPVPDAPPLLETGDQLYAPYLQRTTPLTDVEEEKQKKLLGVGHNDEIGGRLSIRERIEVSQRLQKPKLLSDMSAFKAANHGAVFEDFLSWYGNPQNPLSEEDGETVRRAHEHRASLSPEAAKVRALEDASESIAILMNLRAFWEDSWEEAEPCPASQQQPLFDPYSRVEMVFHTLETIHPSLLMGQALAVNFSSAEFVLETAARPVEKVRTIERMLQQVKTAIQEAVGMLSKDASDLCLHASPQTRSEEDPLIHVSASTIQKCEVACNAIGEMELLLCRALSLWQLCPEAELVDNLLQCQDGSFVFLKSPKERSAFLHAVKNHQSLNFGVASENHFPEAIMREYVIHNDSQDTPCQLNARLVTDMKGDHSALLALTKSSRDS